MSESVGNLTNLQHLDLEKNLRSALPESIGGPRSLIKVDLEKNRLMSLSRSHVNLTSLRKLDLGKNRLTWDFAPLLDQLRAYGCKVEW